jgi:hypothetical protein
MGIEETAEMWIRVEAFCDGLGDDGICKANPGGQTEPFSFRGNFPRGM